MQHAALAQGTVQQVIAGVPVITNVTQHTRLDLDLKDIQDRLAANDMAGAKSIYELGKNSVRGTGMRTLQGFSRGLEDKNYVLFQNYYNNTPNFGDKFIQSAFASTGAFVGRTAAFRASAINTAVRTLNLWPYIINEIVDGITDCQDGDPANNIGGVHSMDEGWAFYVGSLEGTAVGGNSTTGLSLYRMAVQMCEVFNTCVTLRNGVKMARVNSEIAANYSEVFQTAQTESAPCPTTAILVDNIYRSMKVPVIQALIASMFEASLTTDANVRNVAWGRAWALRQTVAPLISRCSPAVIDDMESFNPASATQFPDVTVVRKIVAGLEYTYFCLSLSCKDIGAASRYAHGQCMDRTLPGYEYRTPVMDRAFIDLDVKRINELLGGSVYIQEKWDAAREIFEKGLGSIRANGNMRTLSGLSTDYTKFAAEPLWKVYQSFYKSNTYASDFVQTAFRGTAPFSTNMNFGVRKEGVVKGIQYMVVWYYIIHELEDAVADCLEDQTLDNSSDRDYVASVDEAFAFYAGSSHYSASNSTSASGYLIYQFNMRRCPEFDTCTNSTPARAVANDKTISAMVSMQAAAARKDCPTLQKQLEVVKSQMMVPLVQGMLKYFYLSDRKAVTINGDGTKPWAEGYSFFKALQPVINKCDSAVATKIANNIDITLSTADLMKDGYVAVGKALQSIYPCLKITCEDVGTYDNYPAPLGCSNAVSDGSITLAGYSLLTDVLDRARIDLDLRDMETFIGAENWQAARDRYTMGFNSVRASGVVRSLADLSTGSSRFAGESTWTMFRNYYNSSTYANDLISQALNQQGVFANKPSVVRKEVALKGILYQTLWNYVIHELEEAVEVCEANKLGDQSQDGDDALDVDEAWAFFVGSSHLTDASNKGYLMYQANLKRCPEFKTCMGNLTSRARANDRTLALMVSSQAAAAVHDCVTVKENVLKVRAQMTIPLIQGTLKYAYLADKTDPTKPLATPEANLQKEWAEGFSFARSILPLLHECNPSVASLVARNFDLSAAKPIQDGAAAVTKAIQSTFSCLNISCIEMGAYVPSQTCKDETTTGSSNTSSSELSGGAIAGIVIACIIFYLFSMFVVYKRGKQSGSELGNQNHGIDAKAAEAKQWQRDSNSNVAQPHTNGNGNGKGQGEQIEAV